MKTALDNKRQHGFINIEFVSLLAEESQFVIQQQLGDFKLAMDCITSLFRVTLQASRHDQRAVCFAPRAARRPCPPLDDALSASQTARSSRAALALAARAAGFRLWLGGGRCAPAPIL